MTKIGKSQKGQIASLDFLIGLSLVILATGFMLRFMEFQGYDAKESVSIAELRAVAETASDLLVSNPDWNCRITSALGGAPLMSLSNCLTNYSKSRVTQAGLGIPATRYGCRITDGSGSVFLSSACTASPPANADDIASEDRVVNLVNVDGTLNVSKQTVENCMSGADTAACVPKSLRVRVWRT